MVSRRRPSFAQIILCIAGLKEPQAGAGIVLSIFTDCSAESLGRIANSRHSLRSLPWVHACGCRDCIPPPGAQNAPRCWRDTRSISETRFSTRPVIERSANQRLDNQNYVDQRLTNRRSGVPKLGAICCSTCITEEASSRGSGGTFVFPYFSVNALIS